MADGFPRKCSACGKEVNDAYVILVWKDSTGTRRRAYCAAWISAPCWKAYEAAANALGY